MKNETKKSLSKRIKEIAGATILACGVMAGETDIANAKAYSPDNTNNTVVQKVESSQEQMKQNVTKEMRKFTNSKNYRILLTFKEMFSNKEVRNKLKPLEKNTELREAFVKEFLELSAIKSATGKLSSDEHEALFNVVSQGIKTFIKNGEISTINMLPVMRSALKINDAYVSGKINPNQFASGIVKETQNSIMLLSKYCTPEEYEQYVIKNQQKAESNKTNTNNTPDKNTIKTAAAQRITTSR